MRRTTTRATALLSLSLLIAGCSNGGNTINDQARDGNQSGYVSGDGTVEQLSPDERTLTIELDGDLLAGTDDEGTVQLEPWSSTDVRGEVLVINVWGSWCGPCVEEVPDLKAAYAHFEETGDPVQFIGVNDRDSASAALAFERRHEMPYPSLADDGGQTLLDLQGMATPRPSTLILDQEGRLAARVAGQVDDATLQGLVEDVLEQ